MERTTLEYVGTWDEILRHASDFAGCKLRVTVISDAPDAAEANDEMLAALDELDRVPLTQDEIHILDEMEVYNREHPLTLHELVEE